MSAKEKSTEIVTSNVVEGAVELQPWEHGDKAVVYISQFWWDALSVEDQTLMNETYRVTILPAEPEV